MVQLPRTTFYLYVDIHKIIYNRWRILSVLGDILNLNNTICCLRRNNSLNFGFSIKALLQR